MGRQITYEDIAHLPAPGTNAPSALRFSPDGTILTDSVALVHRLGRSGQALR